VSVYYEHADVETACKIELRDSTGTSVFSGAGYQTELKMAEVRDLDNDGYPDVFIGVDTGGGNGCCWEYSLVSFQPQPHVVEKFTSFYNFDKDAAGATLIWEVVPFYELGRCTACAPVVYVASQFRSGKLIDVTDEYCLSLFNQDGANRSNLSNALRNLTPQMQVMSQSATARTDEIDDIREAASTLILQDLYCDRDQDASKLLQDVWPSAEQAQVRTRFIDQMSRRWPQLRQRLSAWK